MTSFLERYQQGECVQVWADLQRLGAEIRQEPLWSEALAVARETMRRARFNIELLIPRLQAEGYVFGYTWMENLAQAEEARAEAITAQMRSTLPPERLEVAANDFRERAAEFRARARQPARPFTPPPSDVQKSLAELEAILGPLPLSLWAWYEVVGQVDFIGSVPNGWKDPTELSVTPQPSLPVRESDNFFRLSQLEGDQKPPFDPLYVDPIESVLQWARVTYCEEYPWIDVSPDHYGKYYISGSGPYGMRVPNPTMDGVLKGEWHHTTFVHYLRICLAWAGLPGLDQDEEDLRRLTAGFLQL